MTQDDIIRMAREVYGSKSTGQEIIFGQIVAKASAEAERAKVAQPELEPVAWLRHDGKHVVLHYERAMYPRYEVRYPTPLYTAPPQGEWVELTDEEIDKLRDAWIGRSAKEKEMLRDYYEQNFIRMIKFIQMIMKEKNT